MKNNFPKTGPSGGSNNTTGQAAVAAKRKQGYGFLASRWWFPRCNTVTTTVVIGLLIHSVLMFDLYF